MQGAQVAVRLALTPCQRLCTALLSPALAVVMVAQHCMPRHLHSGQLSMPSHASQAPVPYSRLSCMHQSSSKQAGRQPTQQNEPVQGLAVAQAQHWDTADL